ncbi:MAG: DUF1778 domain-containing protein [Cyanobacteria bacterium J06649_4]
MTATREKAERVHCRVTPHNKALLKKAAALSGQDLTSFITAATVERAIEVIDKHERIVLSSRDAVSLLNALENPPEPSETLTAAATEYKATYKTQPVPEYQAPDELI